MAYADAGNTNQAIEDYTRAIDFNQVTEFEPNEISAYISRGDAYANNKRFDIAIEDYTKVIKMDSKNAEAYYQRSLANKTLFNWQETKDDYSTAVSLDPEYVSKADFHYTSQ